MTLAPLSWVLQELSDRRRVLGQHLILCCGVLAEVVVLEHLAHEVDLGKRLSEVCCLSRLDVLHQVQQGLEWSGVRLANFQHLLVGLVVAILRIGFDKPRRECGEKLERLLVGEDVGVVRLRERDPASTRRVYLLALRSLLVGHWEWWKVGVVLDVQFLVCVSFKITTFRNWLPFIALLKNLPKICNWLECKRATY